MFRALRTEVDVARADPTTWEAHEWLGRFPSGSPATSSDMEAVGLPAFYRGLQIKSNLISTLPAHVVGTDGKSLPDMSDLPMVKQPNPAERRMLTISKMVISLLLRGEILVVLDNFIEVEDGALPASIVVVDPAMASRSSDGTRWDIAGKRYPADQVLWATLFVLPGQSRGLSVIDIFQRLLNGELVMQDFQRKFYYDGAMPTIVATVKRPDVSEEQLSKWKISFMEKVAARREPVFLPGDLELTPLSLNNKDAQFLESRQFSLTDMANILGLPPYFLGASGSSNVYSNIVDQRRDLIDVYLRGELRLLEDCFTQLIPSPLSWKFDPSDFLRLDPKAMADMLNIAAGWMTLNEVRAMQGLDPLPDNIGNQIAALFKPGAPVSQSGPNSEGGQS